MQYNTMPTNKAIDIPFNKACGNTKLLFRIQNSVFLNWHRQNNTMPNVTTLRLITFNHLSSILDIDLFWSKSKLEWDNDITFERWERTIAYKKE